MSQTTPTPPSYPQPSQAPPRNGLAIAGLVFGLFGCVPFVTGVLAILFSALGLRKAGRDPRAPGRGLAVAGLVLGLVNIVCWGIFGGAAWAFVAGTSAIRDTGREFISDVAGHRVADAGGLCDSSVDAGEVEALSKWAAAQGELKDVTFTSVSANYKDGVKTAKLGGHADFAGGSRTFTMELVKRGQRWKIRAVGFEKE